VLPVAAVGLAVLLAVSCEEQSWPPEIQRLAGPGTVTVRDSAEFVATVAAMGPVSYQWTCTGGRLAWDWGDSVRWYAPESSGADSVFVVATDSLGRSDADTAAVAVSKLVLWFASDGGGLKPQAYACWGDSVPAGYALSGTTASDTGVMFMFLDSANFVLWQNRLQYSFRIRKPAYDTRPFSDTVPATGYYFAVMDNRPNLEENDYWLSLTVTSP
jgi:hypothetical protein